MYKDSINEVREWLNSRLGSSFYMDEAPDEATYPYRVGHIGSSFESQDGISEIFTLEIDYWCEGKSTAPLSWMILDDRGDGDIVSPSGLDHRRVDLASCYAVFTYDSLQQIEEQDRHLRRLRASYDVRLYYKK